MVASGVSQADVTMPGDGSTHIIRVEAHGYATWKVGIRGEARNISGPVKLQPIPPNTNDRR